MAAKGCTDHYSRESNVSFPFKNMFLIVLLKQQVTSIILTNKTEFENNEMRFVYLYLSLLNESFNCFRERKKITWTLIHLLLPSGPFTGAGYNKVKQFGRDR